MFRKINLACCLFIMVRTQLATVLQAIHAKHISNNLTLEKVFCEVIDLKQKLLFPAAVLRIWMDRHHSFVSYVGYFIKNFQCPRWGLSGSVRIQLFSTPSNLSPTGSPSRWDPPVLCGFCGFSWNRSLSKRSSQHWEYCSTHCSGFGSSDPYLTYD